jgi:taurine dehydrogenase small subunit
MFRSSEEVLIQRYFDAFNRHEIDSVIACFHDEPLLIDMKGGLHDGREAVRRFYEHEFARFPDGRCEMRMVTGQAGCGMAEWLFVGTHGRSGQSVTAIGAEVFEFADGKVKALREYHRLTAPGLRSDGAEPVSR